jgi:uncharacterized protein YcnI
MKKIVQGSALVFMGLALAGVVSAHVTVNPKEAVAGYSVTTVRVPNEKDIATTKIRVLVPEGVDLHGIMPVAGWQHSEVREEKKTSADGSTNEDGHHEEEGRVTEVIWSGGKIGAGEFMEFPLSVQYSADSEKVTWKAYQTYADGEVVPWDGTDDNHPAPVVSVLKEAKVDMLEKNMKATAGPAGASTPWLSVAAIILSIAALGVSLNSKKK